MEGNPTTEIPNLEIELALMSHREMLGKGVGKILPGHSTSQSPSVLQHRSSKKKTKKSKIPDDQNGDGGMSPRGIRLAPKPPVVQDSPNRWLCRFDEQLAAAQRTSTLLDEQVKTLRQENGEMKGFIRDVLYTLNARGYESIADSRGGTINLNRCKGEHFLELKGRDARARQHSPAIRIHAQENLLKAVIGSQEKLIRNLINQVNMNQRNELLGARLSSVSGQREHDGDESELEKSALLEKEILSLVNSLESAIDRNPLIYNGLKEQLFIEASRCPGGGTAGILAAVLARHQLAIGERPSSSSSRSPDENCPRPTTQQMRRKMGTFYTGEPKRNFGDEQMHSSGGTLRYHQQRPPTPTLGFNSHEESSGGPPFPLRPVMSNKNLFSAPPLTILPGRRPATSINEYSSRHKVRGRSRWGSPN